MGAALKRPLKGEWPYVWRDATHRQVREGGRIVSVAANRNGRRKIAGLHIGLSEAGSRLGPRS